MGQKLGLAEEIDARVQLLKRHLPYHESDHVLNLADPWGIERARVYEWTITKLRFFNRSVSRARFTEIASEWIGQTNEQSGEGE